LLCALYHRTFITDRSGDEAALQEAQSPFAPVASTVSEMPAIRI
jgi:hypothetical protein